MKKKKIFYTYLFHVQKQIEVLNNYINTFFLKELPEDFFKIILGLKPEINILLNRNLLIETIIFLIYFKIINGSDISFKLENNILNIKNNDIFDDLYFENIKDLFLDDKIEIIDNSDIPVTILTFNRIKQLKNCIEEYNNNFKIFSHNKVKLFILDDSSIENTINNKKLENLFDIKLISPIEKTIFIEKTFKDIYFKENIYSIFGGDRVNSSYGRNRNFASLYFYNREFISLDDDSLPFTLTLKPKIIYKYINLLEYISENEINSIDEKNETILIPTDFYTHYKYFGKKLIFSKYSGQKDMGLYFILLKQMNINLDKIGVNDKNKSDYDYYLYGNKLELGAGIHTLCTYFPKDFKNRITLSSNLRIEDLIIGANYYIEKNHLPVEAAFSVFHNREKIIKVNLKSIIDEILSKEIYQKYIELISKFGTYNFFETFISYIDNNTISFSKEIVNSMKNYISYLYSIYINAIKEPLDILNKEIVLSVLKTLESLKYIEENELKEKMEKITNYTFKELSRNLSILRYIEYI